MAKKAAPAAGGDMTPQQALEFLASLPAVKSGQSGRIFGLVNMVLGLGVIGMIAIAAHFLLPILGSESGRLSSTAGFLGEMAMFAYFAATLVVCSGVYRLGGVQVPKNPWSQKSLEGSWKLLRWSIPVAMAAGLVLIVVLFLVLRLDAAIALRILLGAVVVLFSIVIGFGSFHMQRYYSRPTRIPILLGAIFAVGNLALLAVGPTLPAVGISILVLGAGQFAQGFVLYLRS